MWWSSTAGGLAERGEGDGVGRSTVQVALRVQHQAPAGVLGQRVQHVVEEANAGVDVYGLGVGGLQGVGSGLADGEGGG